MEQTPWSETMQQNASAFNMLCASMSPHTVTAEAVDEGNRCRKNIFGQTVVLGSQQNAV